MIWYTLIPYFRFVVAAADFAFFTNFAYFDLSFTVVFCTRQLIGGSVFGFYGVGRSPLFERPVKSFVVFFVCITQFDSDRVCGKQRSSLLLQRDGTQYFTHRPPYGPSAAASGRETVRPRKGDAVVFECI